MFRNMQLALVSLGLLSIGLACSTVGLPGIAMPALSPEVKFVLDNKPIFATQDEPLALTSPGTPADPLDELSGCWGAVVQAQDDALVDITAVTVYRFIPETRQAMRWILWRDAGGTVLLVFSLEGTYAVADESSVQFVWTAYSGYTLPTGNLDRTPYDPPLQGSPVQVTLDGDRLIASLHQVGTPDGTKPAVFRRFTCP